MSDERRIAVDNMELRTIRDVTRELGKMVAALEAEGGKFVITKHGKMVAVLLPLDDYAELRETR